MPLRKALFYICMSISVFCLTAGYSITGQWILALIAILMAPVWLLAKKNSDSALQLICLLASVCLAVMGNLTGASPLLMIFGSGFALAVWDLLLFDHAFGNHSSGEQTLHYENKHFQSLALVLGFGLLVSLAGRLLKFQVPFVVLILLIAFTIFGLDRIWGYIKKTGR